MVAQGFLAHLGHQSVLAESCAQARALYALDSASQFDGIMLDIQLGDGSGIELLAELKQIACQAQTHISIAAFTAQIQDEDIKAYQASGFDEVLAKPLNMQSLASWIGIAKQPSDSLDQPRTPDATTSPNIDLTYIGAGQVGAEPLLDEQQINDDLEYLGVDAVTEMLDIFMVSSKKQIKALATQPQEYVPFLHALKGSSASMGLLALSQLCRQLEESGIDEPSYLLLKQVWQASLEALAERLQRFP